MLMKNYNNLHFNLHNNVTLAVPYQEMMKNSSIDHYSTLLTSAYKNFEPTNPITFSWIHVDSFNNDNPPLNRKGCEKKVIYRYN